MSSCKTSVFLLFLCIDIHATPTPDLMYHDASCMHHDCHSLVKDGCCCLLNTDENLPKKNEPLFLKKDKGKPYTLILPRAKGKDGYIDLKSGQEIIMSCPGQNNYMAKTNQKLNNAYCKSGHKLIIEKKEFASESLHCHKRVVANIQRTNKTCHSGKGTVLEIGFTSEGYWSHHRKDYGLQSSKHKNSERDWFPLVTVCHDINDSHTFYSMHTLHGSALLGKVHTNSRPGFSRGKNFLFTGFNPERTYSKTNQKSVLNKLLGAKNTTKYLDSKTKFLARGHLAPDADFIFGTWQFATYFYINVAPQWQSINAGNWLQVESNSRRIATKLRADVEVATGTNGVSNLLNSKAKEHEIYLESNKRVPVPEYFWKMLRYPGNNSCMGFISTNNPYLKSAPKHKCKDICKDFGWPVLQNDFSKGYVYCCDYHRIRKVIPEIPAFRCENTLYFA